ncbi:ribonuclease H family protein [Lagierella sp.]|uniref:ribonuclease H family protein n=1 Tax=Lagierella sp. TaxID=2849657 RepID=UPI002635D0B3|nr:ribonuclease H family protein [Lagierella sp.]
MPETKYYAVKTGRKPGIYSSWEECKKQIDGYSGAVFKKFKTKKEADAFVAGSNLLVEKIKEEGSVDKGEVIAYVDGSFNSVTKACGYGVVLLMRNEKLEYFDSVRLTGLEQYRNVTGEIFGTIYAIEKAIEFGYKKIYIHYDYMGIREWALKSWKANNPLTQKYQRDFARLKEDIEVEFIKVPSHQGIKYNELADKLAKKGAGIK